MLNSGRRGRRAPDGYGTLSINEHFNQQNYPIPMEICNQNKNIYHFDDSKPLKIRFKTSVAFCSHDNTPHKILFLSRNPLNNYETILPTGYNWIEDEIIFNRFILNI